MGKITAGADPDELDRLSVDLDRAADRVRAIQRSLNGQINSSPWRGRNAERFRHQWSQEHRRAIHDAIAFLDGGTAALRRHAREQRRVSGAGGQGANWGSIVGGAWSRFSGTIGVLDGLMLGATALMWGRTAYLGRRISSLRDAYASMGRFSRAQERSIAGLMRRVGLRSAKVLKLGRIAGRIIPTIGTGLAFGLMVMNLRKAHSAAERGDHAAAWKYRALGTYEGLGAIPQVGIAQAAFELPYEITKWAYTGSGAAERVSSGVVGSTIERRYGTEPSPSQMAELNRRNEGVRGMWNMTSDAALSLFAGARST